MGALSSFCRASGILAGCAGEDCWGTPNMTVGERYRNGKLSYINFKAK